MIVRPETERDLDGIREVNLVAFQGHPYSQQTEHLIVEALRAADALELSLVAESDGEVVGHIAFSTAAIGGSSTGWFLLGPVAVRPARQGEGIGRAGRSRSRGAALSGSLRVCSGRRSSLLRPFRIQAASGRCLARRAR